MAALVTRDALAEARRLGFGYPMPGRDKHPAPKWKAFQHVLPTGPEQLLWRTRYPTCESVLIVCGATYGIVVADFDTPEAEAEVRMLDGVTDVLDATAGWSTPRGTQYALDPGGQALRSRNLSGWDFKAERSVTVIPPTPGRTMLRSLGHIQPVPDALAALIGEARGRPGGGQDDSEPIKVGRIDRGRKPHYVDIALFGIAADLSGLPEGGRDSALNDKAFYFAANIATCKRDLRKACRKLTQASVENGLAASIDAEGHDGRAACEDTAIRALRAGWRQAQREHGVVSS